MTENLNDYNSGSSFPGHIDAFMVDGLIKNHATSGTGLRLMECLRLRVKDVDFARREIRVHDGKGAKREGIMYMKRCFNER